jgi:hypothetical protein
MSPEMEKERRIQNINRDNNEDHVCVEMVRTIVATRVVRRLQSGGWGAVRSIDSVGARPTRLVDGRANHHGGADLH